MKLTLEEHKKLAILLERQRITSIEEIAKIRFKKDQKKSIHVKVEKTISSLKDLLDEITFIDYDNNEIIYYGALK